MCNCNVAIAAEACPKGKCLNEAKTPHVHAELIKAWADGAEIEQHFSAEDSYVWYPVRTPTWGANATYRIKPTPKPLWEVAKDAFYNSKGDSFDEWWINCTLAILAELNRQGKLK